MNQKLFYEPKAFSCYAEKKEKAQLIKEKKMLKIHNQLNCTKEKCNGTCKGCGK